MPTIRKLRGNWQCLIRVKHHPNLSKSFSKHEDAKRWGNKTELKIRREDAGIIKINFLIFIHHFIFSYSLIFSKIVSTTNL